jgi:hypothetical protein
MENEYLNQSELTSPAHSHRLERGDIFMAEGEAQNPGNNQPRTEGSERAPRQEGPHQRVTAKEAADYLAALKKEVERSEDVKREEAVATKEAGAEQQVWAAKAWDRVNSLGGKPIDAAERQRQERLVDQGVGPTGPMRADVIANSMLNDEERIRQAERLLGRKLSPVQREKLIAAHEIGAIKDVGGNIVDWEEGLVSGTKANVYNYTEVQLLEKAKLLREAGIETAEDRRLLIEVGIVGAGFTLDRTGIANGKILEEIGVAEKLGSVYSGAGMVDKLSEGLERIMRLKGVPNAERALAITRITDALMEENKNIEDAEARRYPSKDVYEAEYQRLKALGRPEEFREKYLDTIDVHTGAMPSGLMDFLVEVDAEGEDLLYQTVNEIVALSLDTENSDYSLGLYGDGNFKGLTVRLKRLQNESARQKERYERVVKIENAIGLCHAMNKDIVTGSLQNLGSRAALVAPEHIQTLSEVKGAGMMMRLIDAGYLRILAEDGRVTNQNYHQMFGEGLNKDIDALEKEGRMGPGGRTRGEIEKQLVALQAAKDPLGNLLFEDLAKYKPWELVWAFNAARLQHNITLRGPELISMSNLAASAGARGGGDVYESPPMEYAARLMNWTISSKRFNQGEVAGGMVYLNRSQDHFQALRERQGYGRTRIVSISGKVLKEFEVPAMFSLGGTYAGWRGEGTVVSYAPMFFTESGQTEMTTVQERITAVKGEISARIVRELYTAHAKNGERIADLEQIALGEGKVAGTSEFDGRVNDLIKQKFAEMVRIDKKLNKEVKDRTRNAGPEALRKIFLVTVTNPDGSTHEELRPEFDNALGVLLKNGVLKPEERDFLIRPQKKDVIIDGKKKTVKTSELLEVKEQIRRAIWGRIAEENPQAMAMFLSGMDFNSGNAPAFHDGRSLDDFRALSGKLNTKNDETWRSLSLHLTIAMELRLKEITAAQKEAEGYDSAAKRFKEDAIVARLEGRMTDAAAADARSTAEKAKIATVQRPRVLVEILGSGSGQVLLTKEETDLLIEIQAYGQDVSGDMAAVRFSFNPFMNDVVFETVNHDRPGGNYYQRRINDLSAINEGWKKINDVVAARPSAVTEKECLDAFHEAVFAIAGPNSLEEAQNEVLPFFMAILDFWEEGGQYRDPTDLADSNKMFAAASLRKWLSQNIFYDAYASRTMQPNSMAQKWGSVEDSIAYDGLGMRGAINRAKGMSIVRGEQEDENGKAFMDIEDDLKKRYRAKLLQGRFFGLGGIVGALIGSVVPLFGLIAIGQGGKELKKPAKN